MMFCVWFDLFVRLIYIMNVLLTLWRRGHWIVLYVDLTLFCSLFFVSACGKIYIQWCWSEIYHDYSVEAAAISGLSQQHIH